MEQITTVGIDLAKSVFSVHGITHSGAVVLRKMVRRDQLLQTVASLPPCLIGMESVLRRPRMGPALPGARAHGAAHGTEVRRAVP